jgi:tripartite-type tricarboxylate transporter receptor subunit TctC
MDKIERRRFIRGATAGALGGTLFGARRALADNFPARPVTLVAPWPPGGAVDTLCRALAPRLGERLGKSLIIENRPGVPTR